jgi:hypothetical protein
MDWGSSLKPYHLPRFFAAPVPLTASDAWAARRAMMPVDRSGALYDTRMLMGVGIGLKPLVMLILAIALVVCPGREVRLPVILFQAGAAGLSFLVADGWCNILGQSGEIPPLLAVLAAPVAFILMGGGLLLKSE